MLADSPRVRHAGGTLVGVGGLLLTGFNTYLVWQLAQGIGIPWPTAILLAVIVVLMGGRYLQATMAALTNKSVVPEEPAVMRQVTFLDRAMGNLAEGLRKWLEVGLLERVITGIPGAVLKFAESIHNWFESGLLERIITHTPRAVTDGAALLHRVVEHQGLEGSLRSTAKGVFKFNRWIQDQHTGRLRANLQWVFVVLLLIVAMLIWQGW